MLNRSDATRFYKDTSCAACGTAVPSLVTSVASEHREAATFLRRNVQMPTPKIKSSAQARNAQRRDARRLIESALHPLAISRGTKIRRGVVGKCCVCGVEFYAKPSRRNQKYCSCKCANVIKKNQQCGICYFCGKTFSRPASAFKHAKLRGYTLSFCSHGCEYSYRETQRGELSPSWRGGKSAHYKIGRTTAAFARWRTAVFNRDNYSCRWPNCNSRGGYLEPHHIKRYSAHPNLRTEVSNGITLCKRHHAMTKRREEKMEHIFVEILERWAGDPAHITEPWLQDTEQQLLKKIE